MEYDEDLIEDILYDIEEQECDKLVLILVGSRQQPMMKTRIQKMSLIYNQAYTTNREHEAYYFGGYSDDIDESYTSLLETGVLMSKSSGYVLSEFGENLISVLKNKGNDKELVDRIGRMEQSLGSIEDKSLVAITYELFPDLAEKSTIARSISPLIKSLMLNDKPLVDWNADEFLNHVRKGEIIHTRRG
ncbi:MAG: hypothetical protein IKD00_00830 [Candidatus Methanomethylophilaceae archaeon]|nr:hypothetical protein [Candidatus Methanomethylophilaceae archaeon]